MTDLSEFGVDVEEPGPEEDDTRQEPSEPSYHRGRCPAINTGDRQRCRAPVSRMKDAEGFCGTHGRTRDPWTIHDDPESLILLTGRVDALSLDEVGREEVDFDLERIREAVDAIQEVGR